MCRLYANTKPVYTRDLNIFRYLLWSRVQFPADMEELYGGSIFYKGANFLEIKLPPIMHESAYFTISYKHVTIKNFFGNLLGEKCYFSGFLFLHFSFHWWEWISNATVSNNLYVPFCELWVYVCLPCFLLGHWSVSY